MYNRCIYEYEALNTRRPCGPLSRGRGGQSEASRRNTASGEELYQLLYNYDNYNSLYTSIYHNYDIHYPPRPASAVEAPLRRAPRTRHRGAPLEHFPEVWGYIIS